MRRVRLKTKKDAERRHKRKREKNRANGRNETVYYIGRRHRYLQVRQKEKHNVRFLLFKGILREKQR